MDKKQIYTLKTKSLPRVSFAVISRDIEQRRDRIENNEYIAVRYVDTGKMEVVFDSGERYTLSDGEYCIYPRNSASWTSIHKDTTTTVFSFFIDEGEDGVISDSEVSFERSDNYHYVDVEKLFIPRVGKIAPSERPYFEIKQLVHKYDGIGEYANANASAHVWNFFVELANSQVEELKGITFDKKNKTQMYCDRIDEYIEKNYMQPITMTTVADLLVLHENYISRIYKQLRGLTVIDHLRNVRIRHAKALLSQNKYTVAEVSRLVGYQNVKYFIAVFKKAERVSPGKYYHSLFEHRLYSYDLPEYSNDLERQDSKK